MEKAFPPEGEQITLPRRTLITLCGPAGSGKSTFANQFVQQHQGYRATTIVSSDYCRALICDDETNQHVNRDTFDLFHYLINKRMLQNRLTIADSTALQADARQRLLGLARQHNYFTCLFVFNMSLETCMLHDQQQSRGRVVGEQVILYHLDLLQQALQVIPSEGWNQVYVLDEQHTPGTITIASD
jgi:protein phosphatase